MGRYTGRDGCVVGRLAAVLEVPWMVAVVGEGVMGQVEDVVEGAGWARGSFGSHGLSQGRISATGCFGNTGPEKRASSWAYPSRGGPLYSEAACPDEAGLSILRRAYLQRTKQDSHAH